MHRRPYFSQRPSDLCRAMQETRIGRAAHLLPESPHRKPERETIYNLVKIDFGSREPAPRSSRKGSNSIDFPADLNLEIPTTRNIYSGSEGSCLDPRPNVHPWSPLNTPETADASCSRANSSEGNESASTQARCQLHEVILDPKTLGAFAKFCSQYRAEKTAQNLKLRFTKGFDQVGFFICRFLVAMKDWDVEAAMGAVRKARELGICPLQCVDTIFAKHGFLEGRTGPGPTQNRSVFGGVRYRADSLMPQIRGVSAVGDPLKLDWIRRTASQLCGYEGTGFPGRRALRLGEDELQKLELVNYEVTWKSDGIRCLLLVASPGQTFLLTDENKAFEVSGLSFPHQPHKGDGRRQLFTTLLDGEMVFDRFEGKLIPRYLVWDIVHYRLDPIRRMDSKIRRRFVQTEIIEARNIAADKGLLEFDSEPFWIERKDFFPIGMTKHIFSAKFRTKIPHRIEGLILQRAHKPYIAETSDSLLEWEFPLDGTAAKFRDLLLNAIDERLAERLKEAPPTSTSSDSRVTRHES